jgi:hypothetical protein
MANFLYNYARELAATTGLAWVSGTFRAYLIDLEGATPDYNPQPTDDYFDDILLASRAAGPVALANKTATGGACDADDITFTGVGVGPAIDAVVIIKFVTNDADSPLVAYIHQATGLPITPNNGDIIVTWDSGTNKIFRV